MQWIMRSTRRLTIGFPVTFVLIVTLGASLVSVSSSSAQDLGVYSGTVKWSGSEIEKNHKLDITATIKISMPLTDKSDSYAMAMLGDFEAPSATALVTKYELSANAGSPDSDGQITTWTCTLSEPTEVRMMASGVLNVNYEAQTYSMYVALAGMDELPVKCNNSRSGDYTDDASLTLFFGTNEPDAMPYTELPYKDVSELKATYKLVPVSAMKDSYGPVDLEWDFKLSK